MGAVSLLASNLLLRSGRQHFQGQSENEPDARHNFRPINRGAGSLFAIDRPSTSNKLADRLAHARNMSIWARCSDKMVELAAEDGTDSVANIVLRPDVAIIRSRLANQLVRSGPARRVGVATVGP